MPRLDVSLLAVTGGSDVGYGDVMFPRGATFLVTGGAGFIGSNLVEALLALGCRVRCLDDLSTRKRANVDMFAAEAGYEFVRGDVKDLDVCLAAYAGVDYVLHEAAWGSVPRSVEMPLFYCTNNITGTLNMLEAARRCGVRRFVYASSSSVYGDEPNLPKREGREGRLLSPYALTKRADEEWARQYTLHYGLPTYGLRYFNVFGRRQDPEGAYAAVIPRWIRQLLAGERPTINGDGLQSRDFTYVENVVEANLKACLAPESAAGEAFNVAYGGRERLIDVYRVLCQALGVDVEPVFGPPAQATSATPMPTSLMRARYWGTTLTGISDAASQRRSSGTGRTCSVASGCPLVSGGGFAARGVGCVCDRRASATVSARGATVVSANAVARFREWRGSCALEAWTAILGLGLRRPRHGWPAHLRGGHAPARRARRRRGDVCRRPVARDRGEA